MSAWKKKEKALTPEEAIALAKTELAPFWFNTEPLFFVLPTEGGLSLLPLSSSFVEKKWVYGVIDPEASDSNLVIETLQEFLKRYGDHGVGFVLIVRAPQSFLETAESWTKSKGLSFPLVVDTDGVLASALGVESFPGLLFQSKGQISQSSFGCDWLIGFEEALQRHLRQADPGLPLSPPFDPQPQR